MDSFESSVVAHAHQFRAMGSQIQLWLDCADAAEAEQAFAAVVRTFADVETALSRFQPQSELSQVNRLAGQWTAVSPLLWDVLDKALELAERTGGLYDPTLLGALEAAGYVASFETLATLPHTGQPEQPGARGQWSQVRRDAQTRAIWLPPTGRLDLGGIAKGYTAARAVEILSEWGPGLVDAGGDVVAGAAPTSWSGWPVAIAAPGAGETADLLTLWLADAALATSGTDFRRWQHNGRTVHHVIDPRTGRPADTDLSSVSVLLPEAEEAEAVATAVLVLGAEAGLAWLNKQQIPALLVSQIGEVQVTPALALAYGYTTL